MPPLAICSQQHIWTPAEGAGDRPICPVCGKEGTPAAVGSTGAGSTFETLPPGAVPPLADDVTAFRPLSIPGVSATESDAPAVPGYDIVRELGRGGMGVVYLARHRDLRRLVALKMILGAGNADLETRQRFRREAQAVARLQHPGIVQIHDVGEHAGRPYLALEYVDGPNLASRVAGKPLAPKTAARAIETLARAVDYAHRQGIVHRDLTPRNILLAPGSSSESIPLGEGESERYALKITDFGLAKELDYDGNRTETGAIIGTPNYMAPEQAQARHDQIGPATDVHALGVLFYEMLTGRPPYLAETSLDILKQITESEPVPPTRLQPRIPPDAETICLKCLEKDPRRRYTSALELADDLNRFVTGQPIRARPVPWSERALKWSRRRPAAAALIAVSALSLLTILAGGAVYNVRIRGERDRAETNLELAMQAVEEMLSEVGEGQLAAEPRMEEKRRVLLAKAVALHQAFLRQKSDDPRVRRETAEAHRRLADVFRLLERHDSAIEAYGEAIALYLRLHHENPADPHHRRRLAYCHNFRGEVERAAGNRTPAEADYREADRLLGGLCAEYPGEAAYREDRARTLYSLGVLFRENKRPVDAETELKRASDLLSELVERFPETPGYRQHLARACLNLGTVLRSEGRPQEARAAYDQAIGLLHGLSLRFPDEPDYRHELAVTCNNAGNLLASEGQFDEARTMHDRAQVLFSKLSTDFPRVPAYRQELANTWNSLGNVESLEDKPEEALRAWTRAASLLEGLVAERPQIAAYRGDLGMVLGNLGLILYGQSQVTEAREHLERSVSRLRESLSASPGHAVYEEILQDSWRNLAEILVVAGDHAAAAQAAQSLADLAPDSAESQYAAACFLARCARLAQAGESDGAEKTSAARAYGDGSLSALRRAIDKGFHDLVRLESDRQTIFKAVEAEPRFQDLVRLVASRAQ